MVESAVTKFTTKMTELLQIERDAEMEQTADILAQYSFRVSTLLLETFESSSVLTISSELFYTYRNLKNGTWQ